MSHKHTHQRKHICTEPLLTPHDSVASIKHTLTYTYTHTQTQQGRTHLKRFAMQCSHLQREARGILPQWAAILPAIWVSLSNYQLFWIPLYIKHNRGRSLWKFSPRLEQIYFKWQRKGHFQKPSDFSTFSFIPKYFASFMGLLGTLLKTLKEFLFPVA